MSTADVRVPVTTREGFDADVAERLDDIDNPEVGDGWYCVRTNPFPCPAEGCSFVAVFLTAAHRVVLWPEQDDPKLLRTCHQAASVGRNPVVVEYQPSFGPCIPWDLWIRIGKPVHALIERPAGWPPPFGRA